MQRAVTVKMISRSKVTSAEELDPQIAAALSVLGDAHQLVRDAARWRALEPHLSAHHVPRTGEKPALSGLMIGTSVIVVGITAPNPGAVMDAFIAARKLAARGTDGR